MMPRQVRQFIRVNGIDLHYDLADYTDPWAEGEAEVFLLHHGYCRTMAFFQNWVPLLGRNYRVLRLDARGCGDSGKPETTETITLAQFAADAVALAEALGIARFHWVGESAGGIVGLLAARKYPDRLASLTLCNTPFKRSADVAPDHRMGEDSAAAAIAKHGVGGWCRATIGLRLDPERASPAMMEWCAAEMDKTPVRVAIAFNQDIGRADFWPHLPDVTVPTLILASGRSVVAQAEEMRRMQERMPSARLVLFPDYGHGLNLIAPERCVEEIRRFLAA